MTRTLSQVTSDWHPAHTGPWRPGLLLIEQQFSSGCFRKKQKPRTASPWVPGSAWSTGGCVFSPSSRLTQGIRQSSETPPFPPNRLMRTSRLISLLLWKSPENPAHHTEEGPFPRFTRRLVQPCRCHRGHLMPSLQPLSQLAQLVLPASTGAVSGVRV